MARGAAKYSDADYVYAIETVDLWRVYKIGAHIEVPALRGLNLEIGPGHFIALKGRSGSGKTTLLNCLSGLDRPTSGVARVLGHDLAELSDRDLTRWRREQLGFVFQSFGLLPTLSDDSRFTRLPICKNFSVVFSMVSGIASTSKLSLSKSTTVRQVPFTQMLSPSSMPSSIFWARILSLYAAPGDTRCSVPISCMMPVNIYFTT